MTDREKVIKAIECCCNPTLYPCINTCPYRDMYGSGNGFKNCIEALLPDVLAMLKEQKAKCLTKAELDDLKENQFVWIEERTGYLYYLQIIGICRGKTGVSDIQFDSLTSYVERSTIRYGKSYRIWTDKPTEKQIQELKWDG